jgi:RNA polymerase sigma-70 factor, ECF subfamily
VWRKKGTGAETQRDEFAREAMTHLDHLYRIAVHLTKEPDQAHELVQETFARALGSYERFAAGTHMKAWLAKVLHNLFFDRYREAKRWVSVEEGQAAKDEGSDEWQSMPAENPGPEGDVLREELSRKISDAIKKLPEEFRAAVLLVDMEDFSYGEAAEILSCPVGTVRSRLFRARALLHRYLKDYVGAKEKV